MFKRTPILSPLSLFALTTLSLGLTACDDGIDTAEGVEISDDLDSADSLASAHDGALTRLGARFHVVDAATLELSGQPLSADDARGLMGDADGLGLDLATVDRADLARIKPLSDAALELGVPVILENVDDSELLAELIGVGVDAEVVMVTSPAPNRYHVRVYGGGDDSNDVLSDGADGDLVSAEWTRDNVSLAVDEIGAAMVDRPTRLAQSTQVSLTTPENDYRYYNFDMAEESKTLVTGQVASLSLDFEAELLLDSATDMKYVFFRPIGPGQHPGTLDSDSSSSRGYYQESQEISLTPSNSNVSLYKHAPLTSNSGSTYTSTTGWTIGTSGGYPEVSFNSSDQVSTTLSDFSMFNNTQNDVASWRFYMTKSWSDMFEHPFLEKCKVKSLPALAKGNLSPDFEAIYRADDSFTSNVTFTYAKETLFRKIWRGGTVFSCDKNSSLWTVPRDRTVTIHFGSV